MRNRTGEKFIKEVIKLGLELRENNNNDIDKMKQRIEDLLNKQI